MVPEVVLLFTIVTIGLVYLATRAVLARRNDTKERPGNTDPLAVAAQQAPIVQRNLATARRAGLNLMSELRH